MAGRRDRSALPDTMLAVWYEDTGPVDQVMRSGEAIEARDPDAAASNVIAYVNNARARCQIRFTADADHTKFLPALRPR